MKENQLLAKLRSGQPTMGLWMNCDSPLMAEFGARAGFDWVLLDAQHGNWDYASLVAATQVISATDTVPVARVARNDSALIGRVLDMGMMGVVIPLVNSAAEAMAAVDASRYAPLGHRSIGGSRLGLYSDDYYEAANSQIMVSVMIESQQAVERASEIAAVPGVDLIFIGPADLARSMGTKMRTAEHEAAVQAVLQAGRTAGVPVGIYCSSVEEALRRAAEGFQFMPIQHDLDCYQKGLKQALSDWRKGAA